MNLDVVVSSIGHEIRQPLTVITTSCTVIDTLLRKPKIDVDAVRENIDDVTSASVRIGETIDSLRSLFRSPQESQQRIDVNELVLESLSTLATALSNRRIAVSRSLETGLPCVVGHRGQLREVFVNIVQNAIDAMALVIDRPRKIEVRTNCEHHRISVTIEDTGSGIEQDRLRNLFTAAISTKAFGMGLGLSICQMIVERHNGQLWVSSEVGKGTRFEVVLPAEPAAAPPDAQPRVAPASPASIKAEA
jgi:signal transduction histidine kinase